jgi:phosphate starvation-inducible PhoH-like protein
MNMSGILFCLVVVNKVLFSNTRGIVSSQMREMATKRKITMKRDGNIELKSLSQFYKPKTYNQEKYYTYLNDDKIKLLFAVGPAGTGKTMLACNNAVKDLKSGKVDKIIVTRPVVPVEEDIGFLPGNINKKMDPWTRPIFDVFLDFFSQKDIDLMMYNNVIEISPLAYMRGRTFKNAFIIADEMQNSSPNQMLMLTTRIGLGSKMVVTGDLKQSDKGLDSGLSDFINKFKVYERREMELYNNTDINSGIKIVELNNTDIERSPVIVKILDVYNVNENKVEKTQTMSQLSQNTIRLIPTTTPTERGSTKNAILENDAAMIPFDPMNRK